jgi:hypothetical protein
MGIYGSDGVVKTINSMAQDRQRWSERRAARLEAHEETLRSHLGLLPPQRGPGEQLSCPYCFDRFDYGDNCPGCGAPLVGASLLEAERGRLRADVQRGWRGPLTLVAVCLSVVSVLVGVALWFGAWT